MLDFLGLIYKNMDPDICGFSKNYKLFVLLLNMSGNQYNLPFFNWTKTCDGAFPPQKSRFSDSGYDLHLIKKLKKFDKVYLFDTGIAVRPKCGYYFDLVGRSSISKSGWMLANNIGIIDAGYSGSIKVALVKIDENAEELKLPCRLVQIIPRKLIVMDDFEISRLDETGRSNGGFGSSNTSKLNTKLLTSFDLKTSSQLQPSQNSL